MDTRARVGVLALSCLLFSPFASGAPFAAEGEGAGTGLRLDDVKVVHDHGQTAVRLSLSEAPEKLAHFTLADPSRLVIDFHGPVAADFAAVTDRAVDDTHVRRLRVGRHDRRLRVALDLNGDRPRYAVDGKEAVITVFLGEREGEPVAVAPEKAAVAPEKPDVEPEKTASEDVKEPAAAAAGEAVDETVEAAPDETVEEPAEAAAGTPLSGIASLILPAPAEAADSASAAPLVVSAAIAPVVAVEPRDPFRPFHLDRQAAIEPPSSPLERYHVGSLKLVAVIYDVHDPRAMVEDDTSQGYTIALGTKIGNRGGVVKAIDADRVVVEEKVIDPYGEERSAEVVLKLASDEEADIVEVGR